MKLVSWNVNGIRAVVRKNLFVPFVEQVDADIICLQETKAQQLQAELDMAGYHEAWNSADKKGYSGTALFSRTEPIEVVSGFPDEVVADHKIVEDVFGHPNSEGRIITAEFDNFIVVTVYTPNAKDGLGRLSLRHTQWDPAFLTYVKALQKKKPVLFSGDLNVAHTDDDLANPKANRGKAGFTDEERSGFQNYLDAGFIDTFRMFHEGNGFYTWWSHFANSRERNVGWRIDYWMASESLRSSISAADIHPDIMGSDHCPVSITLDM